MKQLFSLRMQKTGKGIETDDAVPQWEALRPANGSAALTCAALFRKNFTLYEGGEKIPCARHGAHESRVGKMRALLQQELEKGVLDVETRRFSGIDHFEPGISTETTR